MQKFKPSTYAKIRGTLSLPVGVFVVTAVLALILIVQTYGVVQRNRELQAEADQLQEEIAIIQLENQQVEYEIQYSQTDSALDRAAREELNLRRENEEVYVVKEPEDPSEAQLTEEDTQEQSWWQRLFSDS